jgi:hypothetical protein
MAWFFAALLLISWAVRYGFASSGRRLDTRRRSGVLGRYLRRGERTLWVSVGGLRRGR